MEEISVEWDALSEKLEYNCQLLVKFQQLEGHCNVPQRQKENGMYLGRWLTTNKKERNMKTR